MPGPVFVAADLALHHDALVDMNVEYLSWVFDEMRRSFGMAGEDLVGIPVTDYVAGTIHKTCGDTPPQGIFYLVQVEGQVAAMGGLRRLRPGSAEIKRLYVRPGFRGMNLGDAMLGRLLADARDFGYQHLCLDTAPFMQAAHRLYEARGFVDCMAYEGTEVPAAFHERWRFMERWGEAA